MFDKALTVYMDVPLKETLDRIYERADMVRSGSLKTHCSILTLHLINNLVYSDTGDKLTRKDKRKMIHIAQKNIVENYARIYKDKKQVLTLNAEGKKRHIANDITKSLLDYLDSKIMVEKVIDKTRTGEVIKVDKHVKTLKKAGITNVAKKK